MDTQQVGIDLPAKLLAKLYSEGSYEQLADAVVRWLATFSKLKFRQNSEHLRGRLGEALEISRFYLSRPDFNLKAEGCLRLLSHHQSLTNICAISGSDANGRAFVSERNLCEKPWLWSFVSVRSHLTLDLEASLSVSQRCASEWYGQYFFGVRTFADPQHRQRLIKHMLSWSDGLALLPSVSNGYMRSTYISPDHDRSWKRSFNQRVKASFKEKRLTANPDPKHVAVLTARWAKVHPTYKNRYALFRKLSERFRLTLVHFGRPREDLERDIFHNVVNVSLTSTGFNLSAINNNDFALAFYPDIGMNVESRFLSNLRVAPVQATTNSHPVSTFGSEIDFFITGVESEMAGGVASDYYSERLVLLPGIGTQPSMPIFNRQPSHSGETNNSTALRIACPWGGLKLNSDLLSLLNRLSSEITREIKFVFLLTLGQDNSHELVLQADLERLIGKNFELHCDLPYEQYMAQFATCRAAIDAFPFGGNTSIIDSILCGTPMISRDGWQFYNKAGSVILKRAGLSDLVSGNDQHSIQIMKRLVEDSDFNERIKEQMSKINVQSLLAGLTDADAFCTAVEGMVSGSISPHDKRPCVIE